MDRDDIISMAQEAGLPFPFLGDCPKNFEAVERFAAMVAKAEREECAKICDGYDNSRHENLADLCADAIRARSQS